VHFAWIMRYLYVERDTKMPPQNAAGIDRAESRR
jgi:hypothetical protein